MRPEAEYDTRSPWFEAFALASQLQSEGAISMLADAAAAEHETQPDAAQPDGVVDALFDCYND